MKSLCLTVLFCAFANANAATTVLTPEVSAFLGLGTAKPMGSCTNNWECISGFEHCLNGQCVSDDAFNRCTTDIDCWPHRCDGGTCRD